MFKLTQARNWIRIHRRKAISISSVGPNPTIHLGHEFPQNLIFKIFEKDHKTVLKIPPPRYFLSLQNPQPFAYFKQKDSNFSLKIKQHCIKDRI